MPRSINLSIGIFKRFGCDIPMFLSLTLLFLRDHKHDVELVINNALLYNKAGTQFHKDAIRVQKESGPILNDLQKLVALHDLPSNSNADTEDGSYGLDKLPPIGDLEPPLAVLELLISSQTFKEDIYMEFGDNPIVSLFNYEFATWKPPPVEPDDVIQSRKDKTKPKRDRKAEVERAKANREAAAIGTGIDVREAEARGSSTVDDDVGATTESNKTNKSRKRASVAPVGQTSLPRVVNDVDNLNLFKWFDSGWILPADQKRGGRSVVDRPPLPPPRKRARVGKLMLFATCRLFVNLICIDHGISRLSIVSTAASDNLTLLPSDPIETKHNPNETDVPMDVDRSEGAAHQGEIQLRKLESVPPALSLYDEYKEEKEERFHNVVTQPNGVVIIEKLDTPATRREKNLRRKAEKQKMAAQAGETNISAGSSSNLSAMQPAPPTMTSQVHKPFGSMPGDDMESELSELSDLASEDPDKVEAAAAAQQELKDENVTEALLPAIEKLERKSPPKSEQGLLKKDKFKQKGLRTEDFPGGTLGKFYAINKAAAISNMSLHIVWAKAGKSCKYIAKDDAYFFEFVAIDSFPWWPAVVHTPTSPNVPLNIYQAWQEKTTKRNKELFIVQFYDKQESW